MPRKPRIDYVGAWHHVMHRGARREPIFKKDAHCNLFLDLLCDITSLYEVEIHAYSLMSNHDHLLLRSRHGNLSRAMKHLNAAYTQRVNLMERWDGPIFRGRFRSQLVKEETSLPHVFAYIHLNPLKAGLITRLQSHGWTSHRAYIGRETAPTWLATYYFESVFDDAETLHEYVLDLHRGTKTWPDQMSMDSGWLGEQEERPLKKKVKESPTRFLSASQTMEKVKEITGESMKRLRETEYGPRANPARRFAVWALARNTQMTHSEIGKLLHISTIQIAHVLKRMHFNEAPLTDWLKQW